MTTSLYSQRERLITATFALLVCSLHFIVNIKGGYGFFRDELYYLACSERLAWGYVDQPPFSVFVLKLNRMLFGDSLFAIRLIPALAHTATVVFASLIVKQMGGKSFAIFLTCLAIAVSPIHLAMTSFYSMNALDILIWSVAIFLVLKIISERSSRFWIWLGIVLGIGLLNKISVLFLGAGIAVGLLATHRNLFTTRWPYISGAIALLIFIPYVIWNIQNDFAHLEFIDNASNQKYAGRTRVDFIGEQLLILNPLSAPLWISGLAALMFYKPLQRYRITGWIFITAFLILFINRTSKGEYLTPAYVCLFAGGAILMERSLANAHTRWIKFVYPIILLAGSAILIPLALPVLPVEAFIAYQKKIGMEPQSNENKALSKLPQFYADMFGWEEKADAVYEAYKTLSKEEQAECFIYSSNYGRCGAIEFFGRKYNLPPVIGSHNNYWLWGPGKYDGKVLIVLGESAESLADDFESVELKGYSKCDYCMPYEDNLPVVICRGLKYSTKNLWPSVKHYD